MASSGKEGEENKPKQETQEEDAAEGTSSDESSEDGSCIPDIEIREALQILDMARVLHALESSVARLVENGVLEANDPIVQDIEVHTDGIAYYLSECGIEPDCSDLLEPEGEPSSDMAENTAANVLQLAGKKSYEQVETLLIRAAETGYDSLKVCIGMILGAIQRSISHRSSAVGTGLQYEEESPDLQILDIPTIEYIISDLEALGRVFKAKQFFPQTQDISPDTLVEAIGSKMVQFWSEIRRRQSLEPQEGGGEGKDKLETAFAGQDAGESSSPKATSDGDSSTSRIAPTEMSPGVAQCIMDSKRMAVQEKMETPLGNPLMLTLEASSKQLNAVVSSTIRKLVSFRQFGNEEVEMAVPRKRIIQALTKNIMDQMTMRLELNGEVSEAPILELLPTLVEQINREARQKMAAATSPPPEMPA